MRAEVKRVASQLVSLRANYLHIRSSKRALRNAYKKRSVWYDREIHSLEKARKSAQRRSAEIVHRYTETISHSRSVEANQARKISAETRLLRSTVAKEEEEAIHELIAVKKQEGKLVGAFKRMRA